jgi:hypothetical protein
MTNRMTDENESDYGMSKIELIPVPIDLIELPFDYIEAALKETITALKSDLHLVAKKRPDMPLASPEYLLYQEDECTSDSGLDFIGKIGLSKIGVDFTMITLDCLGGKQRRTAFEKVITGWKVRYEVYYPEVIRIIKGLEKKEPTNVHITLERGTAWDLKLIDMWNKGFSNQEIAAKVGVKARRVTNRISELRGKGEKYKKLLPSDKERKKRLIKNRDMT